MEQNNRNLQGELVARGFSTDLAAEFLLPDYQPEIKRLLRVRAIPLPVDQYVGGSAAELSGAVEFQALYAAEDSSLWCVTKREDYRLSCPFEAGDFDLSPDASGILSKERAEAARIGAGHDAQRTPELEAYRPPRN